MHGIMAALEILSTQTDAAEIQRWDDFVAKHPDGHLLQTSRWAALKERFGWQSERVALARKGELIAGAQVLLRKMPWGQSLAYVPKGPIVDWHDVSQVRPLLTAVQEVIRPHSAFLLKIEPDIADGPVTDLLLGSYGFRRGHPVQPRSTIQIDLSEGQDAVLANMKQKWRYNVRLAGRKGVVVRSMTREDFPRFHAMNEETSLRDSFPVHHPTYYETAFELFEPVGQSNWLLAEFEGQPLAAIVLFALGGKSWYMWGASSNRERKRMPNHALQWAGMQWAAGKDCSIYDFWGIPDEIGVDPEQWSTNYVNQQGDLWGVYRFKQGFGGQIVRMTGAWDLTLSSAGYRLYRLGRRIRN
ncbi:MAG: peptidoglycan bridge formation glycyltransferase FemA/FemB family protein [Chloroflexota bacterium]|nr:peptidoglycan bridge formation glycyltransferase FemA/FemB family protein [Chloroflexota bacterium]